MHAKMPTPEMMVFALQKGDAVCVRGTRCMLLTASQTKPLLSIKRGSGVTVDQLIKALDMRLLTPSADTDRQVTGGGVGDLLSFVMAKGKAGMAWITVQTHLNVIAVASLNEFSCVIIAEDGDVEADTLAKAEEENIPVLSSPLSSYALAGRLYEMGVR